ncbi:MAG: nitrile hydratase accessory protein [Pseudomonadales bacterium]
MSGIDDLSLDPKTSLPRSNGELVFEEPWESRAFGMAAALADAGAFDWRDFQTGLIAAIAAREDEEVTSGGESVYCYYERWLAALESLVVAKGLVATQDIDDRVEEFSRRPAGHDHDHHHEHGDGHTHAH